MASAPANPIAPLLPNNPIQSISEDVRPILDHGHQIMDSPPISPSVFKDLSIVDIASTKIVAGRDILGPIILAFGWMPWDAHKGCKEFVKIPSPSDNSAPVVILRLRHPVKFATLKQLRGFITGMGRLTKLLEEGKAEEVFPDVYSESKSRYGMRNDCVVLDFSNSGKNGFPY